MSSRTLTIALPRLADTERLASRIAPLLMPGDAVLLSGPIGAGKSAFARALIRSRLGDPDVEVPSPTYTLVQTYSDGADEIWHCDLYRTGDTSELVELGLDAAFAEAITLIEWPDRLGEMAPADALQLAFAVEHAGHSVTAELTDTWSGRLEDLLARS
ncbi:tRNA (adenosine(37)-N6)-threonylcarbamoyltransferase complex ATPase subunit type 1 TsaE [Pelagovum pacificum]|uniref:tRNA threonylcarbamoyladenosine biosynthesis protein TsaE n=1 Tax=Pelagovum pacificum TaxID=2588711 RepID=A0A5C5GIP7_9RHOB|nr:tRNA (adenosine(37)-N6)-threonylcarbamoyltransferase complex ATPase subunit type 1 TsaE [Pelagovum pacificum]QQA42758.1 tRNA (adenosine(37)-N6)-threonylcarbamoyltransferase complex ATPase subunit type 1 TsaE [Pelagovum pacificum]TNY34094.1 tRNA (adenosine(37)-N6)-threonylcarbamoyltransferase complex ATPase subunit type 1 TsaE [Pelagovum pacificum]